MNSTNARKESKLKDIEIVSLSRPSVSVNRRISVSNSLVKNEALTAKPILQYKNSISKDRLALNRKSITKEEVNQSTQPVKDENNTIKSFGIIFMTFFTYSLQVSMFTILMAQILSKHMYIMKNVFIYFM